MALTPRPPLPLKGGGEQEELFLTLLPLWEGVARLAASGEGAVAL